MKLNVSIQNVIRLYDCVDMNEKIIRTTAMGNHFLGLVFNLCAASILACVYVRICTFLLISLQSNIRLPILLYILLYIYIVNP
jgi:hypothetical protein